MDLFIAGMKAVAAALGALAALWGAVAGGRKAMKEARKARQPPVTPYSELADRVTALERADRDKGRELSLVRAQVARLRNLVTVEVRAIIRWIDDGATPPPPQKQIDVVRRMLEDVEHESDN